MIHPGVQFNSVKGDALLADPDFGDLRPYLGVEAVAVHAQVEGRVTQPQQARQEAGLARHLGHQCGLFRRRASIWRW